MGLCLAVGGFNQPSVAVRVASNTRRPAATHGVTRRRTVAASALGSRSSAQQTTVTGHPDLVVELAEQPGGRERLPPRVEGRDAAHHARVAQCLAQQLDEQCAHAAVRPPGS